MRSILVFLISLICSVLHAQKEYNQLDAKGLKHGLWKGVYEESKRPRYQGTFDHGKEIGLFQFFDDTQKGDVIATREFNSKDNSAYTIFYDQNKNKVSEGKVVNKLFEGEWKYYHEDLSSIMTLELYVNGKLGYAPKKSDGIYRAHEWFHARCRGYYGHGRNRRLAVE